jgi:hypothetical protein
MAAEFFRARYAKDPFVSLFVTGAANAGELHVFSNCDRVRLTVEGEPTIELEGQIHAAMILTAPFAGAKADGFLGGVTVHEELRSWGDSKTIAVSVGDAQPGETIAVDLAIRDASGVLVRDWNGHVTISVEGNARLFAYTDKGEVLMSRGEGRAYVQMGRSGEEVVIHAAANGLEPASKTISPRP